MTEEYKVLINDKMTDISELKVTELKVELKKRGLTTSGTKRELYEKLKNYLIKTATSNNNIEINKQMNSSISENLTINATQSDLDSSKIDSSFNDSINKSQDKTFENDVSMNESQRLKRANSEDKDEINHKKAKQVDEIKPIVEQQPPVVEVIEEKKDEVSKVEVNVVETINTNNVNTEVSSNTDVNNKNEMEITINKTNSRSNSVETKSPSRSRSRSMLSRSPSPSSRSRSRSESLSNGGIINSNENKIKTQSNGHINNVVNEDKFKSKSPSNSSTKSESVVKEVPMSGDRNRFSRSRSPKSRWHASPTPDPETKDKKEPENQEEKPVLQEIKETVIQSIDGGEEIKPLEKQNETEVKKDEINKTNDNESDIPKVQRKRRWFTSNNDPLKVTKTVAISSDSLKTYLPEAKIPKTIDADILTNDVETSPAVNETETPSLEENLSINRKVIKNDQNDEKYVQRQPSRTVIIEENNELIYEDALNSNELNKSMSEATPTQIIINLNDKKVANDIEIKKEIQHHSANTDEPERVGDLSPSRESPSNIIHIIGLTRPFTLPQLKELLSKYGKIIDNKFWINSVKSHCYASYESIEEAKMAREALHRTKWPQSNPKVLRVDFATEEQFLSYQNGEKPSSIGNESKKPPIKDDRDVGQRVNPPQQTLSNNKKESKVTNSSSSTSELKSEPLATNNKENLKDIQQKSSNRGTDKSNSSSNHRERDREREREKDRERDSRRVEKEKPVREWDLPKLKSSRSRSRDISMERRRKLQEKRLSDKHKVEIKKEEPKEEQPAKALEDLFKKTNTTPCIYWLPLTDEQIVERERLRQQRREEREKRLKDEESKDKSQVEKQSIKVENNKNEDVDKENKANITDDKQSKSTNNSNSKRSARSRSKSNEINGTRDQSKEDKEETSKRRSSTERNLSDKRYKDEKQSSSAQNKAKQNEKSSSSRNDDRNRSKQSSSHQQSSSRR